MQRREKELEFCKRQGGGLMQLLETHVTEKERVLVDKSELEPQLTGERMDETSQEQLNICHKGRGDRTKSFC